MRLRIGIVVYEIVEEEDSQRRKKAGFKSSYITETIPCIIQSDNL